MNKNTFNQSAARSEYQTPALAILEISSEQPFLAGSMEGYVFDDELTNW